MITNRSFLLLLSLFSYSTLYATEHYPFSLLPRNYTNNALEPYLEPYIDAKTMDVHYNGHHAAYVEKLNRTLKPHEDLQNYSCKQLLTMLDKIPESIRTAVRNNAGGHENHTFFWNCLTPHYKKPSKKLESLLIDSFDSFELFKQQFNEAAKTVFGSGWVWLCYAPSSRKLSIITTPNQDHPLLYEAKGVVPLLALDVWEHAYYLKYQNKRASYIDAFWSVINWKFVEENYIKALKGK